jgi:hypothetical protein
MVAGPRIIIALLSTIWTLSFGLLSGSSQTTSISITTQQTPTTVRNDFSAKVKSMGYAEMHPELVTQLKSKKGGSIRFWEAVSWCETNHDWQNGGYFSGGLGMAQSVWEGYGGRQFASRPPKATKQEQIIVANRMAFFGYQTKNVFRTLDDKLNNKPFFRPAIGWRSSSNWGKQCANWKTRKPARDRYTEAGMVEWLKTRPAADIKAREAKKSGKVSSQSLRPTAEVKSCPEWESKLKAQGLVPVKKFSYIMWRESRCQEKIVSKPNYNGTKDYGLLQINSSWRTVTRQVCGGKNMNVLLNSQCNLKVAKYLFDNGGIGHWKATSGNK